MRISFICSLLTATLMLVIASSIHAAPGGKGKVKDNDDSADFGSSNNLHVSVRFDNGEDDRLKSDGLDYEHTYQTDAGGVQAFIYRGGGRDGNLWLSVVEAPSRGLFIDLSDCIDACPVQPMVEINYFASLIIAADEAIAGGLCKMVPGGDPIQAPARIGHQQAPDTPPGYIHFNNDIKGKSPCKGNRSDNMQITRESSTRWTVSHNATNRACASGGISLTPFSFTITSIEACN